jgi:predicted dehydrogenase
VPPTAMVRFAVVGVKGYSRSHLRMVAALAEAGRGRLAASMIIDKADHPDVVAELEHQGVRVFDDYSAMLKACRSDVDVVTLPVPIYLHAPMTIAALRAGYHVLVEKPVAGSLAEVDDMLAARRASDQQCAVGFQQIYSPVFQTLKEHIATGRLGRVRRIAIAALWPRPRAYYGRNEWAGKLFCEGRPVYDSPFNNALAHQIMNMLYLASPRLGHAASVRGVEAELYRSYDIESFDTGCMRAQTDGDVQLVFAATHACSETMNPVMRLDAEGAHVHWEIGGQATIAYADGRTEVVPESPPHLSMIGNIADAVLGNVARPHCTIEIGRAHAACIDAVHRAGRIRDVPAAYVTETEDGQRIVSGVEEAVRAVSSTGQLFSELGIPFARAAGLRETV